MSEEEPEFVTVSVTCRTVGCSVEGITYSAIPVQVHTVEPRLRVMCGQCGKNPEVVENV